MKRRSVLLFVLILAVPMYARNARRPQLRAVSSTSLHAERIPNARTRALHLLAQLRETEQQKVTPSAIVVNRSARALVLPAAGSVQGANGTFFRSDVTFANYADEDQAVGIMWLPNGNPDGFELIVIVLPGTSIVTAEDFVGEFLELQGLGSVVFLPLDPEAGDVDPDAAIDIYSRIWTPQPNASGTVSQPFPGVEPEYMTNEEDGVVLGLRQDAQYRTNYGLVNISEDDLTFRLTVLAEDNPDTETTVTVPSLSMVQTGIPAGNHGLLSLAVEVTSITTAEFTWLAYGTSTDNTTGDGWVSIVANPWDDEQLDENGQ
jgi:hypothetical protein